MSASRKVQVGDRAEEGPVHVRLRRFNSRLYAVLFTYYFRLLDDAIELKKMLPEGVLSIAIRADFWQLQKNERKAELIHAISQELLQIQT